MIKYSNIQVTGSIDVTGSILINGVPVGSGSASANTAVSASHALRANTAGSATTSTSASFATTARTAVTASGITFSNDANNATRYIPFVSNRTGYDTLRTDSTLRYNPSTDTLTAVNLEGNLTGTATAATTASFATTAATATQVRTTSGTTDTTTWIPLVGSNTTGGQPLVLDTELTYNAVTHILGTSISGNAATATSSSFATTAATATQVRTTSGTSDTTTWIPLVGDNTTGGQSLVLDSELSYNAVTHILGTSISGNAATATQRTTRPHYISARNTTARTSFTLATDVIYDSVNASNGISMVGGVVFELTGGKVYLINASFGGESFSNTSGGFATFRLVDTSNTALVTQTAVLIPVSSTGATYTNPVLNIIYAPVSNISVKIRCVAGNGTLTLREDMTHITITEII